MKHSDHVALLRDGIAAPGGTWADFGSGSGAFTLALADLLGPRATIFAIDRDKGALRSLRRAFSRQFPETDLHTISADFTVPLANPLPPLDGLVIANALHFQPYDRQEAVVRQLKGSLRPDGRFLLVEYDADRGNRWVPYPFSFPNWQKLATRAGFDHTQPLGRVPSRFLNGIYAAVSW